MTFKIEEAELREEQEVTTVEAPQTEFLSFRSVEEYERAVKKTKEVFLSAILSVLGVYLNVLGLTIFGRIRLLFVHELKVFSH